MQSATASPLPFHAKPHHPPATRPHGEIPARPAEGSRPEPRQQARRSRDLNGPTLGDFLAQERRQDEAGRARRAQLVHAALPTGGGVMQRLTERARRQHPTTMAEKWHAIRNGTPKPMEGPRREAFAALVIADVMALAETGKTHPSVAVDTMRAAVVDGTLGHGILEQDRKLLLEVLDRLANPMGRLYKQLNLRLTSDTLPAFTDAQVLEKPTALGSGKFSTVYAVQLMNPDGRAFDGIFKPLGASERGWVAGASGIPRDDPQIAMRNIATVSYAKKLGLDVVADTRVALIDTGRGPFDPDLGLIMERARGKPASQIDMSTLGRPDVCAEVTKLQLLDHLTGQGDRHANNYFINIEPNGRAKVMGIDNDQCFGKYLTHPADIARNRDDPVKKGFWGTGLPPVVDTEMERSIEALTERDIRSMLGDKLHEDEIKAAIARHQGVKDHIVELRANGRVIEPGQWGDPDVQHELNRQNSYVGRERARVLELAERDRARARAERDNAGAATNNW